MTNFKQSKLLHCLLALALLASIPVITGCPSQDKWQKAAALSDDFAHSALTAQQIETDAFHQGLVSPADHQAIEGVFLDIGKDGKVLDQAIRSGADSKTITDAFNAALDTTSKALDSAETYIKNPDTKAKIQIVLTGAKGILDTMKALSQ